MSRSCDASPDSGPSIWWPPFGIVSCTLSAANGRRKVLDVVDAAQDSDPLAQVHHPMGHTYLPSRQCDGASPSLLRAKERIPGKKGAQHPFDLPMVVLRKNRIGSRARPVRDHQDGNLFPGEPSFCGPSAPFSGPSREFVPLPIVGSQEPGFVGFDNPAFFPGYQAGRQGQEPVFPQKGGFRVDPPPPGRLPDRFPLAEFLYEEHPSVLVVKTGKGRFRQRTEDTVRKR